MGSLTAIQAQLDANHPVIIEVWNAYGQNTIYGGIAGMVGYHIVVVTGYDAVAGTIQTVYINDPLAVVWSSGTWVGDGREGCGKDYALSASAFVSAASGGDWYGAAVQ